MESRPVKQNADLYIFQCPHCDLWTEVPVNQVNCHIFRHAFFYQDLGNGKINLLGQIPPHAPKNVCDQLVEQKRIVGCAKPFRFTRTENGYIVEQCDYI